MNEDMNYSNRKNPVDILKGLLSNLFQVITILMEGFNWKTSRGFFDDDFSNVDIIEEEFELEYRSVVSEIQKVWGKPKFSGNSEALDYPDWAWFSSLELSYWIREEGTAYVAFNKEDTEMSYEIILGVITEEGIEELREG